MYFGSTASTFSSATTKFASLLDDSASVVGMPTATDKSPLDHGADDVDLGEIVRRILERKWLVLGCVLATVITVTLLLFGSRFIAISWTRLSIRAGAGSTSVRLALSTASASIITLVSLV